MTSPIWNPLIFSLNIMGCLTKESATFLKIADENMQCNKQLVLMALLLQYFCVFKRYGFGVDSYVLWLITHLWWAIIS